MEIRSGRRFNEAIKVGTQSSRAGVRIRERDTCHTRTQPARRALTGNHTGGTLIFLTSSMGRNKFLFLSHPVYGIMLYPEQTKTRGVSSLGGRSKEESSRSNGESEAVGAHAAGVEVCGARAFFSAFVFSQ